VTATANRDGADGGGGGGVTGGAAPIPIVALDFPTLGEAMALAEELGDLCRFYKVGSELFTAAGPAAVTELRGAGREVMLDLKFHDIPNTVAGAVASARALGCRILTVHAAGGDAMLRAAVEAAGDCRVFAVTVLTSLDGPAVAAAWGRDRVEMSREVVRLATLARDAGVTGVVASGHEVGAIRAALGPEFQVLVPGIRLAQTAASDQRRVVTPARARVLGASYVVVGRTVTSAPDRRRAMELLLDELISD